MLPRAFENWQLFSRRYNSVVRKANKWCKVINKFHSFISCLHGINDYILCNWTQNIWRIRENNGYSQNKQAKFCVIYFIRYMPSRYLILRPFKRKIAFFKVKNYFFLTKTLLILIDHWEIFPIDNWEIFPMPFSDL